MISSASFLPSVDCLGDPNSILVRHKKFLKQLEKQKNVEREDEFNTVVERERKTKAFKDQAAKQRDKIRGLKAAEIQRQNEEAMGGEDPYYPEEVPVSEKPQALTAQNLEAMSQSQKSQKAPSVASKKGAKKGAKPAWAQTAQQMENAKEAEIDELLEFAYELDYEKYMEDFEVRQALAIIKDRVGELTQEPDWKDKMQTEIA